MRLKPAPLRDIARFLGEPTPAAWVDAAVPAMGLLAIDHANCEKKAAASAMALMNRYPGKRTLVRQMSRLAREELRHFEQVVRLMEGAGMRWHHVTASRYAATLRNEVVSGEPDRLLDLLVVGAFIEARSCERFALLAPLVEEPFAKFYRALLASESRHFKDYLTLAERYASKAQDVERRIKRFRQSENDLIVAPDRELRFHSGPPC